MVLVRELWPLTVYTKCMSVQNLSEIIEAGALTVNRNIYSIYKLWMIILHLSSTYLTISLHRTLRTIVLRESFWLWEDRHRFQSTALFVLIYTPYVWLSIWYDTTNNLYNDPDQDDSLIIHPTVFLSSYLSWALWNTRLYITSWLLF